MTAVFHPRAQVAFVATLLALSAAGCRADIDQLPAVSTPMATEPLCRQPLQVSGGAPDCAEGDLTFAVAVSASGTVAWAEAIHPNDGKTQACVAAAYSDAVFIPAARCDGLPVPSVSTAVLIAPVFEQLGLAAAEAARRRTTR
jgi:hypothetical protein